MNYLFNEISRKKSKCFLRMLELRDCSQNDEGELSYVKMTVFSNLLVYPRVIKIEA